MLLVNVPVFETADDWEPLDMLVDVSSPADSSLTTSRQLSTSADDDDADSSTSLHNKHSELDVRHTTHLTSI